MKVLAILNHADTELEQLLHRKFDRADQREDLLVEAADVNAEAYRRVAKVLSTELRSLAQTEAVWKATEIRKSGRQVKDLPARFISSETMLQPFRGVMRMRTARGARVTDSIRVGALEGQNAEQLAERIRGTAAQRYADGTVHVDRLAASALVAAQVAHVARSMHFAVIAANR